MPFSLGGVLNPQPNILCCPDQTDFLIFRTPDGFGAVYLDLVEGFNAMPGGKGSAVQLTNQVWYESTDSVPELIARFAAVKKQRYTLQRFDDEAQGAGLTTRPVPPPAATQVNVNPPVAQSPTMQNRSSIWKSPGETPGK